MALFTGIPGYNLRHREKDSIDESKNKSERMRNPGIGAKSNGVGRDKLKIPWALEILKVMMSECSM